MSIVLTILMGCVLIACLFGKKKYKVLMAVILLFFQMNILFVSLGAMAREVEDKSACAISVDNAIREYMETSSGYLLYLFISSVGFVILVSSKPMWNKRMINSKGHAP